VLLLLLQSAYSLTRFQPSVERPALSMALSPASVQPPVLLLLLLYCCRLRIPWLVSTVNGSVVLRP
jgi:hypothetical protein